VKILFAQVVLNVGNYGAHDGAIWRYTYIHAQNKEEGSK